MRSFLKHLSSNGFTPRINFGAIAYCPQANANYELYSHSRSSWKISCTLITEAKKASIQMNGSVHLFPYIQEVNIDLEVDPFHLVATASNQVFDISHFG